MKAGDPTGAFERQILDRGWVHFEAVVEPDFIERLRNDLEHATEKCKQLQIKNGVDVRTEGAFHHIILHGKGFIDFLENACLAEHIRSYFCGNYILNSFGVVINHQNTSSYVSAIHRDTSTFTGNLNLMLNMIVLLDNFTANNGGTYFLSGSHRKGEKPAGDYFYEYAEQAKGASGDIILFNSNLWHAAGENKTDQPRRALTLTFTRPYLKQQLDYPRALGYELADSLSENLKQLLGYNARIPTNLEEWYQPPEKRLYKPGQG